MDDRHKNLDGSISAIDDETEGSWDERFWAEKRARQERFRELVRTGQRTQESGFFIAPAIARTLKVRHRTEDF